jgi:hypothetical protein
MIGTTTVITSQLPNPSDVGQAVTVKYTVTPVSGSGTPTGTVMVSSGTDSCTGTVAAGQCSLILSLAGSRTIIANYSGDSTFASSASTGVSHTVSGDNSYLYMPILRIDPSPTPIPSPTPVPMAHLWVYNQTGGTLCFELLGTGIGKKCFSSSSWEYGYFKPGYYTYNASARCGSASKQYYYGIGENYLSFYCSTSAAQSKELLTESLQSH